MADRKALEAKRKTYMSCCDIYKENGNVIVSMEMPGVSKDNLDIKVDGDLLVIIGKKNVNQPDGKYMIREIRDGDYQHSFTIDETIDRNKIEASIKNGVVSLKLGLKESEKPRKINIIAK